MGPALICHRNLATMRVPRPSASSTMTASQPNQSPDLHLGSPRFADTDLANAASQLGILAAWRQAVRAHADQAARGVMGSFAVGLHDGKDRVFLAVDRFAQQTLCYRVLKTTDGPRLMFAERADALIDTGTERRASISAQAIFDYLYFHAIPSPRTIFEGVYRLPPGHCAWFENGKLTVKPYWTPTFQEPDHADFDSLKAEFQFLLESSVGRQLDGGKAGCFLSGGTDSSTVAGMIGRHNKSPAATYSIGFDADGYDEMAFARIAANRFQTEHHEYYVTPDDLVRSIPEVARHYDQPFGNSSALPAYYCARMACADGVNKILAGDGGDELFGGNSRYAKMRVFGLYEGIPLVLRNGLIEPLLERTALRKLPLLKKGTSYVEQAKVPMPDRLQMYNLLLRLGTAEVLTPAFLALIEESGPSQHQQSIWSQVDTRSDLNRTLAFDWRYTLAESDLPKVRETTKLASLEVGFPFLDDELLDFSLKLPQNYKLRGLNLRWFFKEALRGFLPDEIITKKKQGFGLPFGVWLTRHPALYQLAEKSLLSLASRHIVRPDFIQTLLKDHLPKHPGYYGEMVWILMMLEQWLQSHAPDYSLHSSS